ncbi:hypothetical protein FRZ03_05345 [Streptomyces misionensis]|uniref:Uncharacterized protein n=1 Tax=Streptomyces misionensis TaxID=67331 RepID=A0A5C6JZG1_9ACTN|nr:hypothetical protein [Streptomyces misionensis]TWV56082.1 hypothetical protein FRZ03_05345 [Streptomyces misionensis]
MSDATVWETAVLEGGPGDGWRVRVSGRPRVLQVTCPCPVEAAPPGARAEGVYVYRRDYEVRTEPLRYGFDVASP